jgi:hypothetical protein
MIFIILITVLLLGSFFSPLITLFSLQTCLLFISYFKKSNAENWLVFLGFSLILVITIANFNNSFHLFYQPGHDFSSYYNNYLKILERSPIINWFPYGNGIEVSLPLINYAISFVVNDNTPYPVFYIHCILQLSLLVILCFKIKKHESLKIDEMIVLLVFLFCFYRFYAGMNALRQGYASFFILYALFSNRKDVKILFILIASSFHITSVAIYFLCKHLKNVNSKNISIFLVYFLLFIFMFLLVSALSYYYNISIIKNKISFLIFNFNVDVIKESIINGVKISILFFFLFIYSVISKQRDNAVKFLLYISITLLLSIHPTLFRLIFPLANVLIGYFYFKQVYSKRGKKRLEVFLLVFIIVCVNSFLLFRNERYNYNFDIITDPLELFYNFRIKVDSFDREDL